MTKNFYETGLTNNKFTTFTTTWCIEDIEIVFTVLATFELVKDGIFAKGAEALSTNKTALMPYFSSCDTKYRWLIHPK